MICPISMYLEVIYTAIMIVDPTFCSTEKKDVHKSTQNRWVIAENAWPDYKDIFQKNQSRSVARNSQISNSGISFKETVTYQTQVYFR